MTLARLLLLLIALNSAGCSFFYYGAQNLVNEPFNASQEHAFRNRMRRAAREAWREICKTDRKSYPATYVEGFEDGFVEFVDGNGTGEPPGAAPPHLRRKLLHSETGQIEIENWFAGFRHGTEVARASGLREKYVMPIPLPPKPPQEPLPAKVVVPLLATDAEKGEPLVLPMRFTAPPAASTLMPAKMPQAPMSNQVGAPIPAVDPANTAPPTPRVELLGPTIPRQDE